jgi:mRNA-degrading endonuclease RelE of RelBE toxin-antitoxin system
MAYAIEFSEDAERHLRSLDARDRRTVLDAIEEQLIHEPTVPTRHRKPLRENPLAAWELRVGEFRVFYGIDDEQVMVIVIAVGVKEHNVLRIDGKEYPL